MADCKGSTEIRESKDDRSVDASKPSLRQLHRRRNSAPPATDSTAILHSVPVPLLHEWTFYFDDGNFYGKKADNYLDNMVVIGTIKTVQEFWRYFNALNSKLDSMVQLGKFNLRIFRKDIKPVTSDSLNKHGGKLCIKVVGDPHRTAKTWFELVLALVGEHAPQSIMLCGAVFANRSKKQELQIWMTTDPEAPHPTLVHGRPLQETSTAPLEYDENRPPSPELQYNPGTPVAQQLFAYLKDVLHLDASAEMRYFSHKALLEKKRAYWQVRKVMKKRLKAQSWPRLAPGVDMPASMLSSGSATPSEMSSPMTSGFSSGLGSPYLMRTPLSLSRSASSTSLNAQVEGSAEPGRTPTHLPSPMTPPIVPPAMTPPGGPGLSLAPPLSPSGGPLLGNYPDHSGMVYIPPHLAVQRVNQKRMGPAMRSWPRIVQHTSHGASPNDGRMSPKQRRPLHAQLPQGPTADTMPRPPSVLASQIGLQQASEQYSPLLRMPPQPLAMQPYQPGITNVPPGTVVYQATMTTSPITGAPTLIFTPAATVAPATPTPSSPLTQAFPSPVVGPLAMAPSAHGLMSPIMPMASPQVLPSPRAPIEQPADADKAQDSTTGMDAQQLLAVAAKRLQSRSWPKKLPKTNIKLHIPHPDQDSSRAHAPPLLPPLPSPGSDAPAAPTFGATECSTIKSAFMSFISEPLETVAEAYPFADRHLSRRLQPEPRRGEGEAPHPPVTPPHAAAAAVPAVTASPVLSMMATSAAPQAANQAKKVLRSAVPMRPSAPPAPEEDNAPKAVQARGPPSTKWTVPKPLPK